MSLSPKILNLSGLHLPRSGQNLFQRIKEATANAQKTNPELKLTKVSIGQPSGPALLAARQAAAEAIMSEAESMHEYQDNGTPGCPEFAKEFVFAHISANARTKLDATPDEYRFMTIPGIKPMLGMVIQSRGAWIEGRRSIVVATMTKPGYPTPRDQCLMQKNVQHIDLPLDSDFLPDFDFLESQDVLRAGDLLMLNFPHNPTGVVASAEYWDYLCSICEEKKIFVANDAAYQILSHAEDPCSLTDIAVNYPGLNWVEMFSASKAGNFTGWRIGAMVGSSEFMKDVETIKGNTDSGANAALAKGVLHQFTNPDGRGDIEKYRAMIGKRLETLREILEEAGFCIAVAPEAGFFILCNAPTHAFGIEMKSAEFFNKAMIENAGIVGVPFDDGDKHWIRYAVCTVDILDDEVQDRLRNGFNEAEVQYGEVEVGNEVPG